MPLITLWRATPEAVGVRRNAWVEVDQCIEGHARCVQFSGL